MFINRSMTTVATLQTRTKRDKFPAGADNSLEMASFFGGNPFASPVGQKIEQATDASLPSENWALNMEICDIINETEDGPKDAMKAIRKRLSQNAAKNFTVVMYTLTVLETCVKNCGKRFHVLVCNKEFVQELVKLIGPKNDPPTAVQEKVLSLVQCWADAFRNQPDLNGVVQVYMDLKQKGIEFPMTDLDTMAPIHTPQRSQPEEIGTPALPTTTTNTNSNLMSPTTVLSPDQLGKLTSELRVVEGNMTVLSEMLSELVPGKEPPSDLQLLQELHATCQAMQERLVDLISQLSNDEITAELLRVNDGLNNLFLRYSRYEKNRKSSSKEREKDEGSLIDLNDSDPIDSVNSHLAGLAIGTSATSQLSSIPSVTAQNNKDDEFDMFAQSRNVTYESSKLGGSSYEANRDVDVLSSSLGATAQSRGQANNSSSPLPVPDLIGMHSERDFDEMAAWLGEKTEESLSSSEFERFLAERAAAAEALPSTTETSSSTPSSRRNKQEEDPMFAL